MNSLSVMNIFNKHATGETTRVNMLGQVYCVIRWRKLMNCLEKMLPWVWIWSIGRDRRHARHVGS